jgi:hypothetical protein
MLRLWLKTLSEATFFGFLGSFAACATAAVAFSAPSRTPAGTGRAKPDRKANEISDEIVLVLERI